jgi:hypothetical protein
VDEQSSSGDTVEALSLLFKEHAGNAGSKVLFTSYPPDFGKDYYADGDFDKDFVIEASKFLAGDYVSGRELDLPKKITGPDVFKASEGKAPGFNYLSIDIIRRYRNRAALYRAGIDLFFAGIREQALTDNALLNDILMRRQDEGIRKREIEVIKNFLTWEKHPVIEGILNEINTLTDEEKIAEINRR